MKYKYVVRVFSLAVLIVVVCLSILPMAAQQSTEGASSQTTRASSLPASDLIQPDAFAASLKTAAASKPLVIHVGFRVLYTQAHIPGSEYLGPGNRPEGIDLLRKRVESLPRTQAIVIYCGCCPWNECPNLSPVFRELHTLGFKDVKVLYIAQNFGKDWVEKGFPAEAGK